MTEYFGLPKEDVNFYRMWGTECQMNILMATLARRTLTLTLTLTPTPDPDPNPNPNPNPNPIWQRLTRTHAGTARARTCQRRG